VQGGGSDICCTADQFHFAWQSLAADGTVSARLASQTNTTAWAKAGVMLRQAFDPGSPFYAALATPANGILIEYRSAAGAGAAVAASIPGSLPVYLEITRTGSTFCAYTSPDGVNWTYASGSCTTISASGPMLAGLAVTSHDGTLLNTATFDTVTVSSTAPTLSPCPAGWTCADIGTPTPAGGQSLSTTGTWTIQGGGADIFGPADSFHFVWQTLVADGTIQARVSSQQNTSNWAKAGLMLRQTSDPSSPYYAVLVTPANGVVVQVRATTGGNTQTVAQLAGAAPVYLEVGRAGNQFTAYTSADGVTWTPIPGSSVGLSITGSLLEGMAVTSHNTAQQGAVTFDVVKPS
jgi:hypothetical protein